jgi:hypothetical protein
MAGKVARPRGKELNKLIKMLAVYAITSTFLFAENLAAALAERL